MKPVKLAYLVSHPIQYHAPLLRVLSEDPQIELKVFFCSRQGAEAFFDPEFGTTVEWKIPLLEGYKYEFLPAIGSTESVSAWKPFSYGLAGGLKRGGFDVLWVHGYARLFNLAAIISARRLGIKVLIRDDATLISRPRSLLKRWLKQIFFHLLNLTCNGFLSVGTRNTEYYLSHGIPSSKIHLLPYTVDNDYFRTKILASRKTREDLRSKLGFEAGRPVILFVGKLIKRKCPLDLLSAYERLSLDGRSEPGAYLLFVGDGEERPSIESRVAELGWKTVKVAGFINQEELPGFYDLCDLFVLPSIQETWGLVVNEVMNAERPVILTSNVGCSIDLVREGENGFIYPAGDVQALASKLQAIISDPIKLAEMGEGSLALVSKYNYAVTLERLHNVFQAIVGSKIG